MNTTSLRSCCTSPSYVFFRLTTRAREVLRELSGQQILSEVPSNMILKRVPPPIWLSAMILLQGLLALPRVAFGLMIDSYR